MQTELCRTLGMEFPIVAFSHCRDVVAAVSNAGGLGVLGISGTTVEELDHELTWIEDAVGDKPYGVDVLLPAPETDRPVRVEDLLPQAHKEFVADLLARYGVPPLPDPGSVRTVSSAMAAHSAALIEAALEHRVGLVASALGPPPPEMVARAHERGVPVAALVGKREHAERQRDAGVDIIVAQGYEAGGHVGEIGTMVLVPEIVDTVAPLPVLAAGGIASGRQVAAALALGAQGVWTGSVWLTTTEAETHPAVVQKFLRATSSDTIRSRASTGKPARQLRSAWTDEWEDPGNPDPLPMPLQIVLTADARARIQRGAHTPDSGASRLINYFVGQVVGSLNTVRPARRVVLDMVEEYVEVVERLGAGTRESA
ncbi:nitronate monooxygenase [Actinoallomurus sp. CA-150999]|uniref:nitronate monooxygenase n=1 Tax=Actinoallomurus sp. CA-150999 TaxID=3239887 RepID=UPI003D8C62B1